MVFQLLEFGIDRSRDPHRQPDFAHRPFLVSLDLQLQSVSGLTPPSRSCMHCRACTVAVNRSGRVIEYSCIADCRGIRSQWSSRACITTRNITFITRGSTKQVRDMRWLASHASRQTELHAWALHAQLTRTRHAIWTLCAKSGPRHPQTRCTQTGCQA